MGDDIRFIDTTFRDGSQSPWAMGMRYGMMEPIAADVSTVGFFAVEVPSNTIFFKKMIRDLEEDPWNTLRMLVERSPGTLKTCIGAHDGDVRGERAPGPAGARVRAARRGRDAVPRADRLQHRRPARLHVARGRGAHAVPRVPGRARGVVHDLAAAHRRPLRGEGPAGRGVAAGRALPQGPGRPADRRPDPGPRPDPPRPGRRRAARAAPTLHHGARPVGLLRGDEARHPLLPHRGAAGLRRVRPALRTRHRPQPVHVRLPGCVAGIDVVEAQLRVASGEPLWFGQDGVSVRGHTIECRINAEYAANGRRPHAGRLRTFEPSAGPFMSGRRPLLRRLRGAVPLRPACEARGPRPEPRRGAGAHTPLLTRPLRIEWVDTAIAFLRDAVSSPAFERGRVSTRLVDSELLPAHLAAVAAAARSRRLADAREDG